MNSYREELHAASNHVRVKQFREIESVFLHTSENLGCAVKCCVYSPTFWQSHATYRICGVMLHVAQAPVSSSMVTDGRPTSCQAADPRHSNSVGVQAPPTRAYTQFFLVSTSLLAVGHGEQTPFQLFLIGLVVVHALVSVPLSARLSLPALFLVPPFLLSHAWPPLLALLSFHGPLRPTMHPRCRPPRPPRPLQTLSHAYFAPRFNKHSAMYLPSPARTRTRTLYLVLGRPSQPRHPPLRSSTAVRASPPFADPLMTPRTQSDPRSPGGQRTGRESRPRAARSTRSPRHPRRRRSAKRAALVRAPPIATRSKTETATVNAPASFANNQARRQNADPAQTHLIRN
jgi:hypothetical protein